MSNEAEPAVWIPIAKFILDFLKIAVSAFLGAYCAFRYERKKRHDEEKQQQVNSLRETQFALSARINNLLILNMQYLQNQKDNVHRWIELPPTLNVTNPPAIPVGELTFLLDNIDPNILGELCSAENRFETIKELIELRNRTHDEFQRIHEKNEFSERLQTHLMRFTDSLYEMVPDTAQHLVDVHEKIENVISDNFNGACVLKVAEETKQMIKDLQVN